MDRKRVYDLACEMNASWGEQYTEQEIIDWNASQHNTSIEPSHDAWNGGRNDETVVPIYNGVEIPLFGEKARAKVPSMKRARTHTIDVVEPTHKKRRQSKKYGLKGKKHESAPRPLNDVEASDLHVDHEIYSSFRGGV